MAKTAPDAQIKTGAASRPAASDIVVDRRNGAVQSTNKHSGYGRRAVGSPKASSFTPPDFQQVAAKIGFATHVAGLATQPTHAPLAPINLDIETRLENAFSVGRSVDSPSLNLPPVTTSQTVPQPLTNPTTLATHTSRVDVPSQPVSDQVALQVRQAVDSGADRIRIQLEPSSLGRIDVTLDRKPRDRNNTAPTPEPAAVLTSLCNRKDRPWN